MKRRILYRFLAFLLCLLLAFQHVPATVLAAGTSEMDLQSGQTATTSQGAEKAVPSAYTDISVEDLYSLNSGNDKTGEDFGSSATVVSELTKGRKENEKHYRLEDGSYTAVVYQEPVHVKDEDGAFQEIVNKLTFDEKEGRYSVSIGDVEKNYAATLNAGELLWVSKGTYELSVSPVEEAAKEIVSSEDEKSVAEEETSSEESFSTEMETVTSEEITAEEETLTGESVTEESITPGAPLVSVTEENEETSTDAETEIEAETSAEESSEEETVSSAEETEAETTAETESETESVSEAETESELETASEVETETESESVTETETETTETVIETTSEEETETITETETEAVTEPETETETETETITEAEEEKTPWTVLRSDVRAEVTNPSVKEIFGLPLSEAADLSRNNSSVIYRDVFPGINYEYENFGYHVKETITVKEQQESYRYSFLLHAPELSARLTEEGEVLFTDSSEEEIFLLPKPWMKDAKGAESEEVFYEIEPVEEGWLLRIIADENWINDSERVSPVAIDPTIRIAQVYHDAFISATYINKGTPNTVHGKQALLYTGYDNTVKEHEIVMGFWYLPTLPENAVVDAAVLQMYHYSWTASTSGDAKLGMYAVENTSLGGETMRNWILSRSWNNTPDIVDSVLDYQTLNASTVNSWKNFDITRAMRTWYADSSNLPILRFRLINYADYQTMKPSLTFVAYRDAWVSAQPVFYLDYRIAAGLEDYYTAESVSIDRAGTAYITDLTRNMTLVKEVAGKASTAFPASVSLIYNSAFGPENLCYATDTASAFSSSKCGKGWKLSLQQTITADANPEYLRYLDADGTIHYFKKESGSSEYKDEDGLGLTITGSSSARTLKDAKNNQYKFNASGLLYEIVDQSGNKLNLTYNSSSQITALTRTQNGAGTENIASFSYDSDGYLASVTDSASRTTSFTYTSGGSLSMITHPDGTTAIYGYSGGTMSSAKDMESGYKIVWLYDSLKKVTGYTEYGGSNEGASVSVTGEDGLTSYRYCGKDRTLGNGDDLVTSCIFDYFGRTITTYTTDANGQTVYGADAAAYTENSGTDKKNNRLTTYGSLGNPAENLLAYPSLEGLSSLPSGWSFSGGGSASISSALPRTGEKSVLITRSSVSDADSVVTIPVTGLSANTWYIFSAYVRTTEGTTTQNASSGSSLMAGSKQGEKVYWGNSGWWERITLLFKTDSSGSVGLKLKAAGMQGSISFDDLQLEKSIYGGYGGKSSVNFLRNGNTASGGGGWSFSDSTNVYYSTAGSSPFTKVIRMDGDASAERKAYQTVKVKTPGSQTYLFSGWAKANSVVLSAGRAYELRAVITYTDNTTETQRKSFCADSTKWQYLVLPVVPKQTNKTVDTIRVEAAFTANPNHADFTGFSLLREDTASYTYDSEGNLTAVKSESGNAAYTYTGADLMQYLSQGSGTFTYTYDSNHRLTAAQNDTLTMSVSYDGKGNTAGTELSSTATSKKVTTSASYNADGTLLVSQTDARGKVTAYGYSSSVSKLLGAPTSVTTPGGTVYRTSYQANSGRVSQSYIDSVISLAYAYTAGRLATLTRSVGSDQQEYKLGYDAYGNPTTVKVGNRTLVTNTYGTQNGPLATVTLGNGFTQTFTADVLERTKRIEYNGDGAVIDYVYGGNGEVAEKYDYLADRIETRDYDTAGRLSTQREYTYSLGNVGYAISQSHFSYDSANRVTEQRYKSTYSGGGTATGPRYYRYTYSNTDGSLTKLTHSYFDLNYSYDGLKRLGSRTLKKDGTALLTRNYTYTAGAGTNGASFLVSKVESRDKNSNVLRSYTYTYDDNGNITAVSGSDAAAYTYDGQNQLLSETKGGVTTSFTYDAAGNILTRTKGGVTDTYTYGDSEWKDLLTAYNNHTITYDAIGNPTAWYDGSSFTWSYGRKLTGITNGSTSISYSYYADGRRLSKTVGSTTTTFNWVGDMLFSTYQNDGTTFEFLYDESGHPAGFWYKQGSGDWNLYFYVTNLQGDITKIINEDGSSIGTYSYDAWGKVTSISGTVAQANPLRYRGYYYDQETGFYNLGSRYYAPEIGRFVNADDAGLIGANGEYISYNLFAYCLNNPVNHVDRDGMLSCEAKFAIGVGIIALAAAVTIATGGAAAGTLAASIHCFASGALVGAASGGFYGAVEGAVQGAVMHLAAKKSTRGIWKTMMEYSTEGFMRGTALGGVLGGLSSPVCFVAGTVVLGENGEVSIENIRRGDLVWSRSEETGVRTLAKVLETYERETKELVHLEIGGVRITTTPEHPFYTAKKGWTAAIELRAGDLLVLFGGEYVILEKVQHEILENPVKVYNIQVEENHTYYVSARGVLVHNSCNHGAAWNIERRRYWKEQASKSIHDTANSAYELTRDNLDRMARGLAPIGWDGYSVELHHIKGITNDFYDYIPVSRTVHKIIHLLR